MDSSGCGLPCLQTRDPQSTAPPTQSSVPDSRCQRGADGKLPATSGDLPLGPMEPIRAVKVRPKRCMADRRAPLERVLVLGAEERARGVEETATRRHELASF